MKKDLKSKARTALEARTVVATELSSKQMEDTASGLRNMAFFSAKTTKLHHLTETKNDIEEMLAGGAHNPAEIRVRMKQRLDKLGYVPEKAGTITDLSSDLRTNLIIEQNEASARGFAAWQSQQNEAIMTVYPAQELYRAMARKVHRKWAQRWDTARAKLGKTTSATPSSIGFFALKNDPIWIAISRFKNPWAPFDYFSGMRLRQIPASKARALGLLDNHPRPTPQEDRIDRNLEASFPPESRPFADALKAAFRRDGEMDVRLLGDRMVATPKVLKKTVPKTVLAADKDSIIPKETKLPFAKEDASVVAWNDLPKERRDKIVREAFKEQDENVSALLEANNLTPSKEGYNFELKTMKVKDLKPSQFGEDYLNDSSSATAADLAKASKGKLKPFHSDDPFADTPEGYFRESDANPLTIWEDGNLILDGNHRHAAASLNGQTNVQVIVASPKGEAEAAFKAKKAANPPKKGQPP